MESPRRMPDPRLALDSTEAVDRPLMGMSTGAMAGELARRGYVVFEGDRAHRLWAAKEADERVLRDPGFRGHLRRSMAAQIGREAGPHLKLVCRQTEEMCHRGSVEFRTGALVVPWRPTDREDCDA